MVWKVSAIRTHCPSALWAALSGFLHLSLFKFKGDSERKRGEKKTESKGALSRDRNIERERNIVVNKVKEALQHNIMMDFYPWSPLN